jgi:hypothetical protein
MENKIETPLQRLIAEYQNRIKEYQNFIADISDAEICRMTLQRIIQLRQDVKQAESLLPYEKEQIKNAFDFEDKGCGCGNCDYCEEINREVLTANQYFNQTFQTNE